MPPSFQNKSVILQPCAKTVCSTCWCIRPIFILTYYNSHPSQAENEWFQDSGKKHFPDDSCFKCKFKTPSQLQVIIPAAIPNLISSEWQLSKLVSPTAIRFPESGIQTMSLHGAKTLFPLSRVLVLGGKILDCKAQSLFLSGPNWFPQLRPSRISPPLRRAGLLHREPLCRQPSGHCQECSSP